MEHISRPPALIVPPSRDFGTFELQQAHSSEAAAASLQGTPTSFGSKDSGSATRGWVVRQILDLTDEGEATPLGGLSTSALDRAE